MDRKSLGRYEIIRALASAPWGPVYEGRDAVAQRPVILHTVGLQDLSEQAATEFTDRFRADALAASRLVHPRIAGVLDFSRADDLAYLVTQHADGRPLRAVLDAGERPSAAQAVALVLDLLAALEHAHAKGIVHRAVRPANLFVHDGRASLTGFGMACIQQSEATTGAKLGALASGTRYMSPEQVQGLQLEARSDLFSVGVVLYELLTGTNPFDGGNAFAVIQRILTLAPAAPSQLVAGLPAELDAVLAKALAKNRNDRFASAREFAQALQPFAPAPVPASTPAPTPVEEPEAPAAQAPAPAAVAAAGDTGARHETIAAELELEYWKDIKESDDPEDFQQFLRSFPDGHFAPLAQRRLRKMGQNAA